MMQMRQQVLASRYAYLSGEHQLCSTTLNPISSDCAKAWFVGYQSWRTVSTNRRTLPLEIRRMGLGMTSKTNCQCEILLAVFVFGTRFSHLDVGSDPCFEASTAPSAHEPRTLSQGGRVHVRITALMWLEDQGLNHGMQKQTTLHAHFN